MCRRLYSMSFRSFSLWWERTFSVSLSYSRLRLCKQIMVDLSVLMRLGSDCPWDLCDLSFVSKCALTCASVSHSGGPTLTSPEGEKQPAVPADSLMSSALPPQRAAARIRPQGADCRGFRSLSLIFLHLCDSSTPIFFSIFWVPVWVDIPSLPAGHCVPLLQEEWWNGGDHPLCWTWLKPCALVKRKWATWFCSGIVVTDHLKMD